MDETYINSYCRMKDDKKTVRFSDLVHRQIFNTNSAILAKTAKVIQPYLRFNKS